MDKLTNKQFKKQIDRWQLLIAQTPITLPNGKPLPDKFFHIFLGVGLSTFRKMMSSKSSNRTIQPYTVKTIHFLKKIDANTFLEEIRLTIPEYLETYGMQQ